MVITPTLFMPIPAQAVLLSLSGIFATLNVPRIYSFRLFLHKRWVVNSTINYTISFNSSGCDVLIDTMVNHYLVYTLRTMSIHTKFSQLSHSLLSIRLLLLITIIIILQIIILTTGESFYRLFYLNHGVGRSREPNLKPRCKWILWTVSTTSQSNGYVSRH